MPRILGKDGTVLYDPVYELGTGKRNRYTVLWPFMSGIRAEDVPEGKAVRDRFRAVLERDFEQADVRFELMFYSVHFVRSPSPFSWAKGRVRVTRP